MLFWIAAFPEIRPRYMGPITRIERDRWHYRTCIGTTTEGILWYTTWIQDPERWVAIQIVCPD